MPERRVDILLIGGGVACAAAARTLADGDFGGSVLLAARELDPPYERPPLTKEYLRGDSTKQDAYVATGDAQVLTRTGVTKLDTSAREATLATKEVVAYDRALIATGAMVRRLQVEGAELEGLHYLRAFGNSDAIRRDVAQAERVVCVGGSYIACEVAASLTAIGVGVTLVMQEDAPFERSFGPQVGACPSSDSSGAVPDGGSRRWSPRSRPPARSMRSWRSPSRSSGRRRRSHGSSSPAC